MAGRKRSGSDDETITATRALEPEDQTVLPAAGSTAVRPASGAPKAKSAGQSAGKRKSAVKAAGTSADKVPGRLAGTRRSAGKSPVPGANSASTDGTVLAFPEPPGRRRRRAAWITAGSALSVTALFFALWFFSPMLELKTVVVEGTTLLPREQAEAALEPLKGQTLPTISDADVEGLLKDRPEIEKIEVAAQPPSTLVVTVTERIPVAVLQDGDTHVLIDEEGRRLAVAADRAAVALPLIAGGSEAINASVFPSITAVLAALPPEVLGRLENASAQTLDSVELKLKSGQTVFWGSADANEAKARVLEALLKMEPSDPPVQVYDVSTPDRPVTR
ncbi:FtsQ-type POTRA domain-containing protein [Arthrobacter sp. zg-Y859]|uniref:FtsQ-type POTRA domain-containing protein n=1 Tax=Arthrobacter jinronghuae TaxID=2964609 RepID=A0ABT1NPT0_9MICC|nr:FtsQ-type POTRA domain-containing protein [Arthrobacter jinronghuae]MCQ1949747.1 FtsQ-type POTRA domain-containing protein [Arthrobacter jinronghuae]UWX79897.1 FtsQ-type POTRA domain-containing protein [Arthrobacter jinronghuae]